MHSIILSSVQGCHKCKSVTELTLLQSLLRSMPWLSNFYRDERWKLVAPTEKELKIAIQQSGLCLDRRKMISDTMRFIREQNPTCFDCGTKKPVWALATFGTMICMDCASKQTSHPQRPDIKSTTLDYTWTDDQLRKMILGGNANAREFFQKHGINESVDVAQKYASQAASLYRALLDEDGKIK